MYQLLGSYTYIWNHYNDLFILFIISGNTTGLLYAWHCGHRGSVLVRVQRNRTKGIFKKVLFEELAHAVMEVKKSHNLLSASWKPRKTICLIQSKSEGLRTKEAKDLNPSSRTGENEMSQLQTLGREKRRWIPSFSAFFVLFRPSMDWIMPTLIGEENLF